MRSGVPLIALGEQGARVAPPGPAWDEARAAFADRHVVRLAGFMDDALVARARAALAEHAFQEHHDGVTLELQPTDGTARGTLMFLANDASLFAAIRALTGCAPIGCFNGRIYSLREGHADDWHEDHEGTRLVGLSVNLGRDAYDGGVFHIRARGDDGEGYGMPNTRSGDAIVFRIDGELQHRVTAVRGGVPKLAFAGWFCSEPRFEDELMRRIARARAR